MSVIPRQFLMQAKKIKYIFIIMPTPDQRAVGDLSVL